jgi:hypothetical protein
MSVIRQQPIRRHFFWAMVIILVLFTQTMAQAAQVTLAWDPNIPSPDGYRVYQRVAGQSYDYLSPVWPGPGDDTTQTTCTVNALDDGTSYYFIVRAIVGNDSSGDSNEINYIAEDTVPIVHSITTDAGAHGSVSPASATVNDGGSQTFSITAEMGCQIVDVQVDGVSVGAVSTYTFSQINADHALSASFSLNSYIIASLADGNGTLSPQGNISVTHGGNQSYSIVPDTGYGVADVLVDGQSIGMVNHYTFSNVSEPHTIRAIFQINHYLLTATAGTHGTIDPSGQSSVAYGGSRSYTITPDNGYQIVNVTVDALSIGAVSTHTFAAVNADHTIAASFVANTHAIAASAGEGGSISPAGVITATAYSSLAFSVTVDQGYELADLIVDGSSLGPIDNYTFSQIDADHTIAAQFTRSNQLPVADAGPDQAVVEQSQVTLSGLNSLDLDDGLATYEWRQIKGTLVVLSSFTEEMVFFTSPDVDAIGEALEFELTVTDFSGAQASDRCIVNVTWTNEPPSAKTGADQSVDEGSTVYLSAAESVDGDDGIAGYQWRQVQGPEVILSDALSSTPHFSAPDVGPQGAALAFELTVTDAGGLQDTDSCMVTVTWSNMAPEADAGPDQEARAGDEVVLDGSHSNDPDGLLLNYQWRQTFGAPVMLSDATAVRPLFTIPMDGFEAMDLTFELTVTDSGGLQGVDACQVHIDAGEPAEDTTPPTLSIENPNREWVLTFQSQIKIAGTADDDQQVAKVLWENNRGGSGEATGTTQWGIESVSLYRGSNTITITAIDAAGNQQSKNVTIYFLKWRYLH